MEHQRKGTKAEDIELKEMICSMQDNFFSRLKRIEEKIEKVGAKYLVLGAKVDNIVDCIQGVPVDLSNLNSHVEDKDTESENLSLCSEVDIPEGSWLGDSANPDFRIRCPISPKDLEHINNTSTSAQKMSLTLLDYLFPREVQACSNLSGTGKHGKKQLDPFKVKGIKYHVTYKFGITENDWNHIKLNIDSKCRTAFRRKLKGMPLNVYGEKASAYYKCKKKSDESEEMDIFNISDNLNSDSDLLCEQQMSVSGEQSLTDVSPVTNNPVALPELSKSKVVSVEYDNTQFNEVLKEQFGVL